jgi:hypothetical protein
VTVAAVEPFECVKEAVDAVEPPPSRRRAAKPHNSDDS